MSIRLHDLELPHNFKPSSLGSSYACAAFTSEGISLVSPTGEAILIQNEDWTLSVVSILLLNKHQILSFHASGVFKIDLSSATYVKLSTDNWGQATGAITTFSLDESIMNQNVDLECVIVFTVSGIFRVKATDGSYVRLSSSNWSLLKGLIFPTKIPNEAIAITSLGSFHVNLKNGTFRKTSSSSPKWGHLKIVLPHLDRRFATILESSNVCLMDCLDGSRAACVDPLSSWYRAKSGFVLKDGQRALVMTSDVFYVVGLMDGKYERLRSLSMARLGSLCDFGPNAGVACKHRGEDGNFF